MSRYALHVTHTLIDFNTHCIMHFLVFFSKITKSYWFFSYISHYYSNFFKAISFWGYLKVFLDVFYIQYANIEATLPSWRTKMLLKTVVFWDLAPHQMFRFYHEFGITDTTTWSDHDFLVELNQEQIIKDIKVRIVINIKFR